MIEKGRHYLRARLTRRSDPPNVIEGEREADLRSASPISATNRSFGGVTVAA